MIFEKELLEELQKENLYGYEVRTSLDEDTDIILEKADLAEFIDFCKKSDSNIVFYAFDKDDKDDYYLDVENAEDFLFKSIEKHLNETMFGCGEDIDIDALVEKYSPEFQKVVSKNNELLDKINWDEPTSIDIYVVYRGINVGIIIENENDTLLETLDDINLLGFMEMIYDDIDSYCDRVSEEHHQSWEQERAEAQKRHVEAVYEIKELLKTDEKLIEYTNGKLRHGYAKQLTETYSDKYDVYITVGEIDMLVDAAYKERKNK